MYNIEDRINLYINNIPKELKELNIWCCFNDRLNDNYLTLSEEELNQLIKTPRDLKGNRLYWSNKSRFFSFDECLDSLRKGFNNGLGIIVKPKKGLIVIDYDNCIIGKENLDKLGLELPIFNESDQERIQRDINLINSYTELSPSGKGIHIYLFANIDINTKTNNIEIYDNKFIRVSGDILNEYYDFNDKTKEINELINLYGLDEKDIKSHNIVNSVGSIYKDELEKRFKFINKRTNKEILDIMFNSKKGNFYNKLYNGLLSDDEFKEYKENTKYYKLHKEHYDKVGLDLSNSDKSITLILILLYFCNGDLKATKELFIKSKLCRDDYLEKRYNKGKDDKIDNQFIPKAISYFKNFSIDE